MTTSVLDGIPGLGETRKKRLVKELGGVRKVQAATLEDLRALSWLPDAVADAVYEKLHDPELSAALTTGNPAPSTMPPRSGSCDLATS